MTKRAELMKRPPKQSVLEWVVALGVLTTDTGTHEQAEMKCRAYVPLLQEQFGAGAFTQESLHHVASKCRYFPSYGEVVEHLRGWWREHRPTPPALPAPPPEPPRPDPTPEEIAAVSATVREVVAALRSAAAAAEAQHHRLDDARSFVAARHLTPAQLDQLNPLPGGRKRTDADPKAEISPRGYAGGGDSDDVASPAGAAGAGDP